MSYKKMNAKQRTIFDPTTAIIGSRMNQDTMSMVLDVGGRLRTIKFSLWHLTDAWHLWYRCVGSQTGIVAALAPKLDGERDELIEAGSELDSAAFDLSRHTDSADATHKRNAAWLHFLDEAADYINCAWARACQEGDPDDFTIADTITHIGDVLRCSECARDELFKGAMYMFPTEFAKAVILYAAAKTTATPLRPTGTVPSE